MHDRGMAGSSEQTGSISRRWRRKRGRQTDLERNRGQEERGVRVDRIATDTSRPTGTWNTSCYSTVCALSDGQISGACLSVCLSVASCEAHRWAGRWLPTHRSELVLSLQGHLPGETKDRAWNPALIRQAQEQVSEYMGPQISGPSWCGVATHADTRSAGSCREAALSNTRTTGLWPAPSS